MRRSVVNQFGVVCIVSLLAVAPVLAQAQAAASKAEDIKAMLLGTTTWHADWIKPYDVGVSEIVFEARGEKVVANIKGITLPTVRCEHDVTITTGVVKFDACLRQNVTLRFDPNDREYPFKGSSEGDFEWKLKCKYSADFCVAQARECSGLDRAALSVAICRPDIERCFGYVTSSPACT